MAGFYDQTNSYYTLACLSLWWTELENRITETPASIFYPVASIFSFFILLLFYSYQFVRLKPKWSWSYIIIPSYEPRPDLKKKGKKIKNFIFLQRAMQFIINFSILNLLRTSFSQSLMNVYHFLGMRFSPLSTSSPSPWWSRPYDLPSGCLPLHVSTHRLAPFIIAAVIFS